MNISKVGIELIKKFEGCVLFGYKDPVGIPTIGYGHTGGVVVGQRISQAKSRATT
jgi:lysozyme